MSGADFPVQPEAGPYVLGPDGRLMPVDRKRELRHRIRAVLRSQTFVSEVLANVANSEQTGVPLWISAVDVEDAVEAKTAQG